MNGAKTLPDWTPSVLAGRLKDPKLSGDLRELCERLATYPTMKMVWARLSERRIAEGYDQNALDFDCLAVYSFAWRYVIDKPFIKSQKSGDRQLLLSRIERHAKLLARYMKEIGLPENAFWYAPKESLMEFIEEDSHFFNDNWAEGSPELNRQRLEAVCHQWSYWNRRQPPVNIYEMLAYLADSQSLEVNFPFAATVQRSRDNKAPVLAFIRGFAQFLQTRFELNPREETGLISNTAQAVFPDFTITTHTVKDTLRRYKIPREHREGDNWVKIALPAKPARGNKNKK